jgi:hypothetical protein
MFFAHAVNGDSCFVHNLEQIARSPDLTRKSFTRKAKKRPAVVASVAGNLLFDAAFVTETDSSNKTLCSGV